ncbi:ATP-dependent RecD-like DNA helicase, partial [bacterium]|nr:ATP-dependent RecD-like DNA helicase [bacterium]
GKMIGLKTGETMKLEGSWSRHPKYGLNFNVKKYSVEMPATVGGIRKFLASGLIDGIGKVYADRIVAMFKEKTLDVIEKDPEKLLQVSGIGKERLNKIKAAWSTQKGIRNLIFFLQDVDISTTMAAKIYKTYSDDSINVLKKNPYKLTDDIFGVGFKKADDIAIKLGIEKNAPIRVESGIEFILKSAADEGHCYLPELELMKQCSEILKVDEKLIPDALDNLALSKRVVLEIDDKQLRHIYLSSLYSAEKITSDILKSIKKYPAKSFNYDLKASISETEKRLGLNLADKQRDAVFKLFEEKILIVTGGPGTGKTTLIRCLVEVAKKFHIIPLLAAPTGRAAKKLSESSGHIAKTIHRLLEFNPGTGTFMKDQTNTLEGDIIVIDEVSMVDISLMSYFLKAAKRSSFFLFIGDVNQLPSVGPGNVLRDMISSGQIPIVELTQIFRQAQHSLIVTNAHLINEGAYIPKPVKSRDELLDFYFIEQNRPPAVLDLIKDLINSRIPRSFKLDPMEDIQVLSPMNKGEIGVINLNVELQALMNNSNIMMEKGMKVLRLGDKVMQVRNNYDKEVFNGDIGRICAVDNKLKTVQVKFDEHLTVLYDYEDLDELVLAYAVSIHKSQGSEYPAVIIPILTQHFMLLQRNLLYTAVTRAKKLAVLIGDKKAVYIAMNNNKVHERYTNLAKRLRV